jgi:hypothetical protein
MPVTFLETTNLSALVSCTMQEARVYAEENGLFFIETSAKTAANVNDIFYEIGTSPFLLTIYTLCCLIVISIKKKFFNLIA